MSLFWCLNYNVAKTASTNDQQYCMSAEKEPKKIKIKTKTLHKINNEGKEN